MNTQHGIHKGLVIGGLFLVMLIGLSFLSMHYRAGAQVGSCVERSDNFNAKVLDNRWKVLPLGNFDVFYHFFEKVQGQNFALRVATSSDSPTGALEGNSDKAAYIFQEFVYGDFEAKISVLDLGDNDGGDYIAGGLMVRANTTTDSPHVSALLSRNLGGQLQFKRRATQGGIANEYAGRVASTAPVYLKIVRTGNVFSVSYSTNNSTWTAVSSTTVVMPDPILVGMVTAGDNTPGDTDDVLYDDFVLCGTFPTPTPTPTPYAPEGCNPLNFYAVENLSPARAQIDCLVVGSTEQPFIDSTSTYISWLPKMLMNKIWVKTYDAHKTDTSDNFIQLRILEESTVYVAYNHDHYGASSTAPNPGPNWLAGAASGWTYAYQKISVRSGTNRPAYWDIWQKTVPANTTVTLGGNRATGYNINTATHYASNMYFALVDVHRQDVAVGGGGDVPPSSTQISDIPPFFMIAPEPRVIILYDNSGSMTGNTTGTGDDHNRSRAQVGRDVLADFVDSISGVHLGLATYDGKNPRSYPGNPVGCPSGTFPRWPGKTVECLTSPCDGSWPYDIPITADILAHPKPLSPDIRRIIKYGDRSGTYNGRIWPSYPAFSNNWLDSYFADFWTTSCYYQNMQGTEGIARNIMRNYGGYTPIAGSLWGVRDYLRNYYFPQAMNPASPFYNNGAHCTAHYVILVSDGEETCEDTDRQNRMNSAAASLRAISVGGVTFDTKTYVIGLGFDANSVSTFNQIADYGGTDANLDHDNNPATGNLAFSAATSTELAAALSEAINQILQGRYAGSAVAVETDTVSTTNFMYRALFFPQNWSGDVEAFPLDDDGKLLRGCTGSGCYPDNPVWTVQAGLISDWSSRPAYTSGNSGLPLVNINEDPEMLSLFNEDERNYLRGDPSKEQRGNGSFRNRVTGPLGDVIHSSPLLVGRPPFNYEFNDYESFKNANEDRKRVLYFGANDGFLHAVDSTPGSSDVGKVLWSYCPRDIFGKLPRLFDPLYTHDYFVDGPAMSADVYTTGQWRTLVTFALRGGGMSYHILDVTDPDNPKFFWVYSNPSKVGFAIDKAKIVRTGDNTNPRWVMFIASGVENTDGFGHLIAIDLETRMPVKDFVFPTGHSIITFSVVDANRDSVADTIYAGDVLGFVWKLDIRDPSPAKWDNFYKSGNDYFPLFRCVDPSGNPQPITAAPEVASSCNEKVVFVGTGKLLNYNDRVDSQQQSFYAFLDTGINDADNRDISRISHPAQFVNLNLTGSGGSLSMDSGFTLTGSLCQYIDFVNARERVTIRPKVWFGYVTFVSGVTESDPCGTGGYGYVYDIPYAQSCKERNEGLGDDRPVTIDQITTGLPTGLTVDAASGAGGFVYDHSGEVTELDDKAGIGAAVQPRSWKEIM